MSLSLWQALFFFFRQDREAEGIFNGVRTARMALSTPIFSSVFIAGEFARVWYPLQPKTCRKCGAKGHFAATCNSQCCFNCENPGDRSEDCPLSPLRGLCLNASHPTTELPFIYYSASVSTVKVSGASYAKIAEQAEDADDQRRKEREEKKRVERERREEGTRQEERARREKEREMQKEREEEKQRRKEERKQKERDDRRGKDGDRDCDRRNSYVNEWRRDRDHRRDDEYDRRGRSGGYSSTYYRDRSSYHTFRSDSEEDDDRWR